MPPLVSEDSDSLSDIQDDYSRQTTDAPAEEDAVADNSQVADPAAEKEPARPGIQQPNPDRAGAASSNSQNDHDLGAQLQRSAEESLSTAEEATGATPADTNGDVLMKDVDTEGQTNDVTEASSPNGNEDDKEDEEDAEAEEDEEDEDEDEEEQASEDEEPESKSGDGDGDSSESSADGNGSHSSSSSEDEADEIKQECLFCAQAVKVSSKVGGENASHVTCDSCGKHAHLACAEEKNAIKDDSKSGWKCPSCLPKPAPSESPKEAAARSKNSAPRLVRDLLPVTRGVQKPNSHSIFAQPLISGDEEGGRALRKRKSPTPGMIPPKRRRKATPRALASQAESASESRTETDRSVAHSTRRSNQQKPTLPIARILQHRPFHKPPPHKLILAFRLDQSKIEKILSKPPRPGKRRTRDRRKPPKIPPPVFQAPVPKFPALPTHHLIFPTSLTDREAELNAKPYGGILAEADADTSRSLPQLRDREIFEIARKEAEEERRKTSAAAEVEINGETSAVAKPNRTVSGPPSKIKCIQFGKFVIDTFYAAPYPEEYSHESRLFICEFCLKYLPSEFVAYRHKLKCPAKHPPGDEIYRDGSISVWEVDGRKKTEYCQCLCLMAKMFLGSKTLYYDVEPFLFYILTEYDEFGYHFVGYFSKEKRPASQNNVSCILVMPIHQRKGYATFLIDFSYLLTRIEGKDGSPEKPLSDMGLTAYRSYWDLTVSRHLLDMELKPFSTKTLMQRTGMTADDVIHSLERLYAFIRDPVTKTYAVRYDKKLYERIVSEFESKKHRELRPENLVWTPYIMGRSDQATVDGQPLHTIAPREGDEDDDDEGDEELPDVEDTTSSKAAAAPDEMDIEQVSPRSKSKSIKAVSPLPSAIEDKTLAADAVDKDTAPHNLLGMVAPGPPSTEAFNNPVSSDLTLTQLSPKLNGLTNGNGSISIRPTPATDASAPPPDATAAGATTANAAEPEPLSGYALACRTFAIPPTRFQIDPPIPASMLRARSTKKRGHGTAFGPKAADSPIPVAVRSSPRNAASTNGSTRASPAASPEKMPGTPVRRSGRAGRSGLANVEVASSTGLLEEEEEDDDDEEEEGDDEDEEEEEEEEDEDEDAEAEDDVVYVSHGGRGSRSAKSKAKLDKSEDEDDGSAESESESASASSEGDDGDDGDDGEAAVESTDSDGSSPPSGDEAEVALRASSSASASDEEDEDAEGETDDPDDPDAVPEESSESGGDDGDDDEDEDAEGEPDESIAGAVEEEEEEEEEEDDEEDEDAEGEDDV